MAANRAIAGWPVAMVDEACLFRLGRESVPPSFGHIIRMEGPLRTPCNVQKRPQPFRCAGFPADRQLVRKWYHGSKN